MYIREQSYLFRLVFFVYYEIWGVVKAWNKVLIYSISGMVLWNGHQHLCWIPQTLYMWPTRMDIPWKATYYLYIYIQYLTQQHARSFQMVSSIFTKIDFSLTPKQFP